MIKIRRRGEVMSTLWAFWRYIAAIIIASLAGEIVAVPAATFIDIVAGAEVTGGRWPLTLANVILVCFKGSVIGCIGGAIAKKRGMLVAALAAFLPLGVFVAIELIQNRDMSEYIEMTSDTKPALWVWVALLPAMISGYLTAKAVQARGRAYAFFVVGGIFLVAANIGASAFHLYTVFIAYRSSGGVSAFLTLGMPPLSEIYWFINIWRETDTFFNLYALRLIALLSLYLIGGVLFAISTKRLEKSTALLETLGSNRL